jgi:hypothetical protein
MRTVHEINIYRLLCLSHHSCDALKIFQNYKYIFIHLKHHWCTFNYFCEVVVKLSLSFQQNIYGELALDAQFFFTVKMLTAV